MSETSQPSPRCVWCQAHTVSDATAIGSHRRERWYHCSYCNRFFSVRSDDARAEALTPLKPFERRLILANN
jgi:hypothetical protein